VPPIFSAKTVILVQDVPMDARNERMLQLNRSYTMKRYDTLRAERAAAPKKRKRR